ncbi:MAG: (S)-ureidoglycine aminohydrolase [bacterium]|jgi:(S)-ureidoglycine aminohydrolase
MSDISYYAPQGGLPPQTDLLTNRAIVTQAYTVIPKGVLCDIVSSSLPFWSRTRSWIIAKPMLGFATTFSQYIMEVSPGGGSDKPEPDKRVQGVLFIVEGSLELTIEGHVHKLNPGGYAYLPAGAAWAVHNVNEQKVRFHWIRKVYEVVEGIEAPPKLVSSDREVAPTTMPGTDGRWATTRFVDPEDLRHDMHVTIVTLAPGAVIPFMETHVMEHGLYVLQGKGVYRLNQDWVEVEAGDYMWLRAFCPQACYAGGPDNFRYLLYKDVNRHPAL